MTFCHACAGNGANFRTHERTNGRVDGRTNGWTDRRGSQNSYLDLLTFYRHGLYNWGICSLLGLWYLCDYKNWSFLEWMKKAFWYVQMSNKKRNGCVVSPWINQTAFCYKNQIWYTINAPLIFANSNKKIIFEQNAAVTFQELLQFEEVEQIVLGKVKSIRSF